MAAALAVLGAVLGFFLLGVRCVVEGTPVDTPSGPVAIEQLRVGDEVWARGSRGTQRRGVVVAVWSGYTLRHRRLLFEDGRSLAVTGSHPVASATEGFVAAGRLAAGMRVTSRTGPLRLTGVDSELGWTRVYDLAVEPGQSFFAGGVLVHNKSIVAWESGMIGDVRSVISAQAAYQEANAGCFDGRLECLAAPAACIPGYPGSAPSSFLDKKIASLVPHDGYRRELLPGPAADCDLDSSSPTSVSAFAYRGVPIQLGENARRGFCGDQSGMICVTPEGETPPVENGTCLVRPAESWQSDQSPPQERHSKFRQDSPCEALQ